MPTLEELPLELRFQILQQLCGAPSAQHPLLQLSLVCSMLRSTVDAYCATTLAVLQARGRAPPPASPTSSSTPSQPVKVVGARAAYLQHVWAHCEFCYGIAPTRAVMVPETTCCRRCEDELWPGRVQLRDASARYASLRMMLRLATQIPRHELPLREIPQQVDLCSKSKSHVH